MPTLKEQFEAWKEGTELNWTFENWLEEVIRRIPNFKPATELIPQEGVTYFAKGRFRDTDEIAGVGYFELDKSRFSWWTTDGQILPTVTKEHFKDLLIYN